MPTHRRNTRSPRALLRNRRVIVGALCAGALGLAALGGPALQANAAGTGATSVTGDAPVTRSLTQAEVTSAKTKLADSSASKKKSPKSDERSSKSASRSLTRAETAKPKATKKSTKKKSTKAATPAPVATPAAPAPVAAPVAPVAPAAPVLPQIAGLDQYQVENAATIVKVGRDMGVGTRAEQIAIATSLQESKLYNLDIAVDHDSLGLFQQRPSSGWGTPAQLNDPAYAARAFYNSLIQYTGDYGCLTCAAQRVQVSAFPDAYAQWEGFAVNIVAALGG